VPHEGGIMIRTLAAALATTTCLVALATPAAAQTRDFNIPAGALRTALDTFARQSGRQVIYRGDEVRSTRSPGVRGARSAEDALDAILAGTGFRAQKDSSGAFAVAKVGNAPAAATAGTTGAGEAQPIESGAEEIVVTGTNIAGQRPVGSTIRTIASKEIARSGYTTTEQLVQSIPENFRGGSAGASSDAQFSSGSLSGFNTTYGTGLNLHALGANATLTLINGHRIASSGSGYFTDVSTIPLSAIDHIEVLSDGASAVYGTDAIGGVVNIILLRESEGLTVGSNYGVATEGGYSTYDVNARAGHKWASGGFTLGADYQHQSRLDSSDRSFTDGLTSPTSVLPNSNQLSLTGSVVQHVTDSFEIHADAQYSRTTKDSYIAQLSTFPAGTVIHDTVKTSRWNGSLGANFNFAPGWTARFDFSSGRARDWVHTDYGPLVTGQNYTTINIPRFTDETGTISGTLFRLPGGPVSAAIGLSHRAEEYRDIVDQPPILQDQSATRDILSEYAEIRVPLFTADNALPGLKELIVSAAVRNDHYSDFGGTMNPRIGASWSPATGLKFRGTFSRSFRAPATGDELLQSENGTKSVVLLTAQSPDRQTLVPIAFLIGAQPRLKPERARNYTFGVDYEPQPVPGLKVSATYYDVRYTDRLSSPPLSLPFTLSTPAVASFVTHYSAPGELQSVVNAIQAQGVPFVDLTGGAFGANPLATAVYSFDARFSNVATTSTSGVDLGVSYQFKADSSEITTQLDGTYIGKFTSVLTPGAAPLKEVGALGYPARLKIRGQVNWQRRQTSFTLTGNYVSSYKDTSSVDPRRVSGLFTMDAVLSYAVESASSPTLNGLVLTLSAVNIFDRKPPYVVSGNSSLLASHYDAANASPLGRIVSVQLRKSF